MYGDTHQMREMNHESWPDRQCYPSATSSNFFNQQTHHYYPNLDPKFLQLNDDMFNKRPDQVFQTENIYEKSPCFETENFPGDNAGTDLGVATDDSTAELFGNGKDDEGTAQGENVVSSKSGRAWVDFDNL